MSHKSKRRGGPVAPSSQPLKPRIEKACQEGRFKQALELARQNYKHDPSEANLDLLRGVTVQRGQQLLSQGYTREAAVVFANAVEMGGSPEFLQDLAGKMAASGAASQALGLLERLPQGSARGTVLAQAADGALRRFPEGRSALPPDLQGQYDLIVQAFSQAEAGQDEQARTTLQGIGLQSPFLEWKLLLRGLLAYYQNDDSRALENWQRLDEQRLSAKLAAPLRLGIDPAFRAAQPSATLHLLQQWNERLRASGLMGPLNRLQTALADPEELTRAWQLAREVVSQFKRDHPHLVGRLADCFFWTIVDHGHPEDLQQYRRLFGGSPGDPNCDRLEALAAEHFGALPIAHQAWRRFEQSVAAHPEVWPGDQGRYLRAMIWAHMGQNAALVSYDQEDMPEMLRDFLPGNKLLDPPAEKCFETSLRLAPERLATHEALCQLYVGQDDLAKAQKACEALLERFPDNGQALDLLADLCMAQEDYARAVELLEKARRQNPLDRILPTKQAVALGLRGRTLALAKQFDAARQAYEQALNLVDRKVGFLCQWAVAELKAGEDERADELMAQARTDPSQRLAVMYAVTAEGVRAKLQPAQKKKLAGDFEEALQGPVTSDEFVALLDALGFQRMQRRTYTGQKGHEKKILELLQLHGWDQLGEDHLLSMGRVLGFFEAPKVLEKVLQEGRQRFPENPEFHLLHVDFLLHRKKNRARPWTIEQALNLARTKVEALPAGREKDDMRQRLRDLQEDLEAMSPMNSVIGAMMQKMMGKFPGGLDEEFEQGFH